MVDWDEAAENYHKRRAEKERADASTTEANDTPETPVDDIPEAQAPAQHAKRRRLKQQHGRRKQHRAKSGKHTRGPRNVGRLALLFAALTVAAGWYLSPWNHVASLAATGSTYTAAETLVSDSGLQPAMTLPSVRLSESAVNRRLTKRHLNINAVSLKRDGRTVTLQVDEAQPIAVVIVMGERYPVFDNQRILNIAVGDGLDELPLLELFDEEQIRSLVKILQEAPDEVVTNIRRITNIEDGTHPDHIALEMKDGNVIVSFIPVIGERIGYYPNIVKELGERRGIINMEVGIFFTEKTPENDPYAKPEEEPDSAVEPS